MKLIDRLISQLDTLVAFLALFNEEGFTIIREHRAHGLMAEILDDIFGSYTTYRTHLAHGAFVLGYSYAEAFLADLIREIYIACPMALPREKELKFRDVLERSTYADVLDCMIDKEVLAVMYNRMENIIEYFHEKLGLQWPSSETDTIIEANLLRNCIVHNNAVVDSRLATHGERWSKGATIALTYSDVNRFGVAARSTAEDLYGQAEKRFLLPRTR